MSNENDKPGPVEGLERKLGGFVPAPASVERDRLMFLAGRANAESVHRNALQTENLRHGWLWPASTAALAATSLALAMALMLHREPREVIVYREGSGPAMTIAAAPRGAVPAEGFPIAGLVPTRPAVSRVPAENYLRTREVALRMGLDAIGSQSGGPAFSAPQTYGDLLLGLVGPRRASEGSEERRENPSNM